MQFIRHGKFNYGEDRSGSDPGLNSSIGYLLGFWEIHKNRHFETLNVWLAIQKGRDHSSHLIQKIEGLAFHADMHGK